MSKNELRGSGKQRSCAFANSAMNCNVLCVDELMPAAAKG